MNFSILGPLEVVVDENRVPVRGVRRMALLIRLLVSANRVVPAWRLAEDVWDGSGAARTTSTLASHVFMLRDLLGKDRIQTRGDGYLLRVGAGEFDAPAFEADLESGRDAIGRGDLEAGVTSLRRALAWWRGPALCEVADMSWARAETTRLNELRHATTESLLEARVLLGQHHDVVVLAEAAVDEEPLRERRWLSLVLALYRCGRQADALRTYQRLRKLLETELGIEPSPELVALDAAILRQDPGLDFLPLSDVSAPRVGTPPSRPDIAPRRSKGRSDPVRPFTVVGKGRKDRAVRTSTASVDGNVPRALARIFGRDNEVSEVHSLLVESWLVSLIGTGGVGKTTLALAVAEAVAGSYPDGVWWLELASVRAGGDVIHMVASVLGVRENIGQSLLDTICEAVGQRRLLLVLDNCEHVVAEVAAIVATLGRRCSGLGVLTTSRERLGVPGERLVRVGPLAAETADDPAMELLLDRMDRPDVARDPIEAAALLDICQHLEGLPLALELAGARCISLRPSDVAARLKARVRLLSDSHRVEERQQTLEATVRWSFELLLEPEQVVFARLAVFVGGFTLDAAEAVCGDDGYDDAAVDDAVASLVDKSLVERDGRRYRMLETTRAFALEALDRQADTDRVQRRHVAFFVALVQRVRLGLRCGDESIWSEQLGADWPNVRAAFRRSVDHDDVEAATTVVANLSMEALFRRPEGLAWSKEAAERFGGHDGPLRHELLGAASFAEWALGNLERGIDLGLAAVAAHPAPATATDRLAETAACANLMWAGRLDESVEISTAAAADAHVKGETWNEMMFLTYLAYATGAQGAIDDALRSAQRAVVLADAMGSPTGRSWTSLVVARLLSDSKTALHLVDKALELARSVDNEWLEFQLILERARRLSRLGEPREALEHVTACAVQLQRQGRFLHAWRALIVAAEVHAKLGNNEVAAVLLGASRRSPAAAPHAADIDKIESTLTVASSGEVVADLAADGARLTLPEAIQRLVDATPTRS